MPANIRKYKILSTVLAVILLILCCGCNRRPPGVLSDKEMEDLLVDMSIADAYEQSAAGRNLPDSIRRNIGERVLKAHGVDYATLDSTYIWYAANLDEYQKLYARVEKRLGRMRAKVEGESDTKNTDQPENDIWDLPKHILFSPLAQNDALVFELPGETVGSGERLEWKMWIGNNAEAKLLLGVDYSDGTKSIIERSFNGERNPEIKLMTDTGRVVNRVFGVMSVPRISMPVTADSIRLIRFPYDSIEYGNLWSQRFFYSPVVKKKSIIANDSIKSDSVSSK